MPAPKEKPTPLPLQETLAETQGVYPSQALPAHEKFGAGLRFQFGKTKCDVYPTPTAAGASPLLSLRSPRSKMWMSGLTTIAELKAEAGEKPGILFISPEQSIWLRTDGSYVTEYRVPENQAPQQPARAALTRRPAREQPAGQQNSEPGQGAEKQPRVTQTGFFGKVLDGFPAQTQEEPSRVIYKILIGNQNGEKTAEGKEKITWTKVVALEPQPVQLDRKSVV